MVSKHKEQNMSTMIDIPAEKLFKIAGSKQKLEGLLKKQDSLHKERELITARQTEIETEIAAISLEIKTVQNEIRSFDTSLQPKFAPNVERILRFYALTPDYWYQRAFLVEWGLKKFDLCMRLGIDKFKTQDLGMRATALFDILQFEIPYIHSYRDLPECDKILLAAVPLDLLAAADIPTKRKLAANVFWNTARRFSNSNGRFKNIHLPKNAHPVFEFSGDSFNSTGFTVEELLKEEEKSGYIFFRRFRSARALENGYANGTDFSGAMIKYHHRTLELIKARKASITA